MITFEKEGIIVSITHLYLDLGQRRFVLSIQYTM